MLPKLSLPRLCGASAPKPRGAYTRPPYVAFATLTPQGAACFPKRRPRPHLELCVEQAAQVGGRQLGQEQGPALDADADADAQEDAADDKHRDVHRR